VRNTPGGVRTPVDWGDEKETFIHCLVPRAGAGERQDWIKRVRSSDEAKEGKTRLSYGINYDECKEEPTGYRELAAAKAGAGKAEEFRPLITRLVGKVADSFDRSYKLDVKVASSVRNVGGEKTISYEMAVGKGSQPVWVPDGKPGVGEGELKLAWQSAESNMFIAKVRSSGVGVLSEGKSLRIEIPASRVEVSKRKLIIYAGGEKIAITTAPAYVPSK
jgi:hypothetical protein